MFSLSQLFHSSFTIIKRLSSSSSLSAIRVVSSAYLRLLIFLLAVLIPACDLSSLAFRMMYSAYELSKQGDNIQPCTSFPILNQSNCQVVPCNVLTCFLTQTQVSQETKGDLGLPSVVISQFVVIHIAKGFSVVSEAEVDVYLEFPCLLCDPTNVGSLASGTFAFSKPSLYIWNFSVHILPKPSLKDFQRNLASM